MQTFVWSSARWISQDILCKWHLRNCRVDHSGLRDFICLTNISFAFLNALCGVLSCLNLIFYWNLCSFALTISMNFDFFIWFCNKILLKVPKIEFHAFCQRILAWILMRRFRFYSIEVCLIDLIKYCKKLCLKEQNHGKFLILTNMKLIFKKSTKYDPSFHISQSNWHHCKC